MALRISSCITGTPDNSPRRPVPATYSATVLRTSPMTPGSLFSDITAGSSASTNKASLPSVDSSLPWMISFDFTWSMSWLKASPSGSGVGNNAPRNAAADARRRARGKHRDDAARAVDQLQVDRHVAQLFQRRALEQLVALDDHQHVEFVRREAVRDFDVIAVFRRVGAEQLAERIVDLQARETDGRADAQHDENEHRDELVAQRKEAHALDAERQIPRLDGAGGKLTFG